LEAGGREQGARQKREERNKKGYGKTQNLPHQPNRKRKQKFQDGTCKAAYATYTAPDTAK